jgi:hypothetical protein
VLQFLQYQKSYGIFSLTAKNPTKIKIRSGQNSTAMGWPKLQQAEMSHCDEPSIFGGVENCHMVEVSQ